MVMFTGRNVVTVATVFFTGWIFLSMFNAMGTSINSQLAMRAQPVNCLDLKDDRAALACLQANPGRYPGF